MPIENPPYTQEDFDFDLRVSLEIAHEDYGLSGAELLMVKQYIEDFVSVNGRYPYLEIRTKLAQDGIQAAQFSEQADMMQFGKILIYKGLHPKGLDGIDQNENKIKSGEAIIRKIILG